MSDPALNPAADWRSLYQFPTRRIAVDGHGMHLVDSGAGSPLLMLHGNPTWSFYWRSLIEAFQDRYRVVAPDHLGCGFSDKPQGYDYCLESHANNLASAIRQLDLRQITLLAHDWGGAIGLLTASRMPERFARFVLFNTGAFPPPRVPWRILACRLPWLGSWGVRRGNLFARAAQFMALENRRQWDPRVLRGLIAPYDRWANRVAIDRFVRDIPLSPRHPTHAILERLEDDLAAFDRFPVLLAWGMRDWCFTPACLQKFVEHLPSAEVAQFPEAGHWVVEDAGPRVIERLERFFREHPLELATRDVVGT